MILLAFDAGRKKTGIAIGNTVTGLSRPLAVVRGGRERQLTLIGQHLQEWRPQKLLIGLPCYLDGREHGTSRFCRAFARLLQQRFNLPVALLDERLTTAAARTVDTDAETDSIAAGIILQEWLWRSQAQNTC